jgi:hypothetical protein
MIIPIHVYRMILPATSNRVVGVGQIGSRFGRPSSKDHPATGVTLISTIQ